MLDYGLCGLNEEGDWEIGSRTRPIFGAILPSKGRCIIGYASVIEVDLILPQAISSARPDQTGDKINLINIPGANLSNPVGVNRIPDEVVEYYISLADSRIDGSISQQYKTPLKKCVHGEWTLDAAISEYNQNIEVTPVHNLNPGDEIVVRDDDSGLEENHIIATIVDQNTVTTLDNISIFFSSGVRILRVAYPPPVNEISARMAASFIYDKYFASQNDPNISEYGNEMRKIAMGRLNDILNGKVILECQQRIGDRFGNPWLDSSYAHRTPVDGYNTSERDLSRPQ